MTTEKWLRDQWVKVQNDTGCRCEAVRYFLALADDVGEPETGRRIIRESHSKLSGSLLALAGLASLILVPVVVVLRYAIALPFGLALLCRREKPGAGLGRW